MSAGSYKALVDVIRKHCLLEPPRLAELSEVLARQRPDPKNLVKLLLEGGWLTAYQVKQLSKGKGQDLHLNQYVLLEPIGVGGMGQVYKARHVGLNRLVALKIIRKDRLTDSEAVRRFQREIEVVAQLTHPNIVLAYDADQIGERLFLAMEYVPGIDVARLLKRSGAFKIHEACEIVRQTALGLQHAFERGLVHRDVKPSNLLVFRAPAPGSTGSGAKARILQVKILDLGLARLRPELESRHSTSVTQEGLVLGTLDYISPEQAVNASQVDIRADLYSLGCTFYHMLAGEVPFPGGSAVEKVCRHQTAALPPLRQHRAEIAPALASVVERLLAKHPDERYQTPAEFVTALADAQTKWEPASPSNAADRPQGTDSIETTIPMDAETLALGSSWAEFIISTQGPTTVPTHPEPVVGRAMRIVLTAVLVTAVIMGIWLWKENQGSGDVQQSMPSNGTLPSPKIPDVPMRIATVDANRPWQDTYVDVREAVAVTILAQGEWQSPRGKSLAGGMSVEDRSRNVLAEAPYLCLVGRIGTEGKPFALEAERSIFPLESGRLFVRANTLDLAELSGQLTLTIRGGRPRSGPAPAPKPSVVEAAELAWQPLATKLKEPTALTAANRTEVVKFLLDHPGTPQATLARTWLGRLPSPLDNLHREQIAKDDLPSMPLPELVAVYPSPVSDGKLLTFALAPDGSSLAAAYSDGNLVLWDALKRTVLQQKLASGGETKLAFSPNGQYLATTGKDDSVTLLGLPGGRDLGALTAVGEGPLGSLAFSPDGSQLLTVDKGKRGHLWDINSRQMIASLRDADIVLGPYKSPDAERTLRLWLVRGRAMEVLPGHKRSELMAISPYSMFAAFADGPALAVYDLSRAQVHARCKDSQKELLDIAFSPDGQLVAAAGRDGSIKVWESLTGQYLSSLENAMGEADQIQFSPDGQSLLALHRAKKTLQVWEVATGQRSRQVPLAPEASGIAWTPDGKYFALPGEKGNIYLLRWPSK